MAQYGTAENGYYPDQYAGTCFTGTVTSTNDETREITLSYTNPKNGKTQTFIGVLEEGYSLALKKDGSIYELKPSRIRPGTRLKVYYLPSTSVQGGIKRTVNTVFLIAGAPNARMRHAHFMAFQ